MASAVPEFLAAVARNDERKAGELIRCIMTNSDQREALEDSISHSLPTLNFFVNHVHEYEYRWFALLFIRKYFHLFDAGSLTVHMVHVVTWYINTENAILQFPTVTTVCNILEMMALAHMKITQMITLLQSFLAGDKKDGEAFSRHFYSWLHMLTYLLGSTFVDQIFASGIIPIRYFNINARNLIIWMIINGTDNQLQIILETPAHYKVLLEGPFTPDVCLGVLKALPYTNNSDQMRLVECMNRANFFNDGPESNKVRLIIALNERNPGILSASTQNKLVEKFLRTPSNVLEGLLVTLFDRLKMPNLLTLVDFFILDRNQEQYSHLYKLLLEKHILLFVGIGGRGEGGGGGAGGGGGGGGEGKGGGEMSECAICLHPYQPKQTKYAICPNMHVVCEACKGAIMAKHSACPTCLEKLEIRKLHGI